MENYNRPPQAAPAKPVVAPTNKPAGAIPASKPGGTTQTNKPGGMTPVNKPGGATQVNTPPAGVPNRPAVNPSGKPLFTPGRPGIFPAGARPFLRPDAARPLKAGEMPFRPVKKDSVPKDKQ